MSLKEEVKEVKEGGNGGGGKQNQVGNVMLFGVPIVSLIMDGKERLCLAQISSTLLKEFSYNEIHNRRVALGINCVQCTPVQLEILRRAGAMPVTSRRCGMITRREAERLCKSFLGDHAPPQLPENFAFDVYHECGWGCRGSFVPSRYNSSRAKCIRCSFCQLFFSPNKFIFHSHRLPESRYVQPDAANFNSWRRHMKLCGDPPEEQNSSQITDVATAQIVHAWEDVKAMFNGGTRKRLLAATTAPSHSRHSNPKKTPQTPQHQENSSSHKKEKKESSTPSVSSTSQPNQQHSSPQYEGQPPFNQFMSTNPLIWNPALPQAPRPQPPFPISFHPLSIPWLRRPLFPFSHPFGPSLVETDSSSPEKRQQSAFKPVRTDPLFNWLSFPQPPSLPEDLSVHGATPAYPKPQDKPKHQVHLTSQETDDENVDIESTIEEECSSTSSVWVSSTTLSKLSRIPPSPTYSSGADELSSSDNQEEYQSKRKRLWVSEIISDEEEEKQMMVNSVPKKKMEKVQSNRRD